MGEEDETEIDPRVEPYANRAAYLERVQAMWWVQHTKSLIRINYWEHSLKHHPNHPAIKNKIAHHKARANRQNQVISRIQKRIDMANEEIDSYLTESQKKMYDRKRAQDKLDKQAWHDSEVKKFKAAWAARIQSSISRLQRVVDYFKQLLDHPRISDRT